MAEIVFAVLEKMFSVSKIVIFLVEKTIGASQKHFCVAPTIFFVSEISFSIMEMIVGETPAVLSQPPTNIIDSNGSISRGHEEIRKIVTGLIQRRDENKANELPTSNL